MNKIYSVLLLALLTTVQAQSLSPQVKKSIDAHATAFTGRHCDSRYTSKPAKELPAGRFGFATQIMDAAFKQLKTEHPEITFRSDNNGKDLYRVQIGRAGNMAFVVGYLNQGKFYTYGCELR